MGRGLHTWRAHKTEALISGRVGEGWRDGLLNANLVGCECGLILVTQGEERKGNNVLQLNQLEKILSVLGAPSTETWPDLAFMPHYEKNTENVQDLFRKYRQNPNILRSVLNLKQPQDAKCYDLLKVSAAARLCVCVRTCTELTGTDGGILYPQRLLEFDPNKRITAKEALRHPWFKAEPLAVQRQNALRSANYPTRIKPYLQKLQNRRRS